MKLRVVLTAVVLTALLAGCAAPPQTPISLAADVVSAKTSRIGVAMTPLPTVDTRFPGADCLLCLAAASVVNRSLTTQVQTWSGEELSAIKSTVAGMLRKKGMDVVVIDDPLDIKGLPSFSTKEANFARQDHSALKRKYQVDKLLVIDVTALGAWRNYSAYIPTSDPKAVLKGTGYLVNLGNNALEWYLPVDVQRSSDGAWDEPPQFPGLTNAYFQALEAGKDSFIKPFE